MSIYLQGMDKLKEFFGNKNWSNALSDPKIIGTAAAVVVAFYYIKMKRQQVAFSSSFENQSIEFPVSTYLCIIVFFIDNLLLNVSGMVWTCFRRSIQ